MSPPQLDTTFFALGRQRNDEGRSYFLLFKNFHYILLSHLPSLSLSQKGNFRVVSWLDGGKLLYSCLSASIHSFFSSHVFSHALHFAKKNSSRIIFRQKTDLLLEFHKGKKIHEHVHMLYVSFGCYTRPVFWHRHSCALWISFSWVGQQHNSSSHTDTFFCTDHLLSLQQQ